MSCGSASPRKSRSASARPGRRPEPDNYDKNSANWTIREKFRGGELGTRNRRPPESVKKGLQRQPSVVFSAGSPRSQSVRYFPAGFTTCCSTAEELVAEFASPS